MAGHKYCPEKLVSQMAYTFGKLDQGLHWRGMVHAWRMEKGAGAPNVDGHHRTCMWYKVGVAETPHFSWSSRCQVPLKMKMEME